MSTVAIRKALEERLKTMQPALATAWENLPFTPAADVPYQRVLMTPATPENASYGAAFREVGLYKVTLCYPQGSGTAAVQAQADALRQWFSRATTLRADGIEVIVRTTPAIGAGAIDGDRYCVPVSIDYLANLGG